MALSRGQIAAIKEEDKKTGRGEGVKSPNLGPKLKMPKLPQVIGLKAPHVPSAPSAPKVRRKFYGER